jgi:hypothetical protein
MSIEEPPLFSAPVGGADDRARSESGVPRVLPAGQLPDWCTAPPPPMRFLACGRHVSPDAASCPYRQFGDAKMLHRRQVLRDTLTALSGQSALETCTEQALANLARWSKDASPITRTLQVLPGDWGDGTHARVPKCVCHWNTRLFGFTSRCWWLCLLARVSVYVCATAYMQ